VRDYPIVVPARTFYDGSVNYYNLERLGGVLSHLNKTLKPELVRVLGPDHSVITAIESSGIEPQDVGKVQSCKTWNMMLCCLIDCIRLLSCGLLRRLRWSNG
jgi:hypothetical protein